MKRIIAWVGIIAILLVFLYLMVFSMTGGSVAVIGGSDGPTAIYLPNSSSVNWVEIFFLLIAGGGIIALLRATKTKKNEQNKK